MKERINFYDYAKALTMFAIIWGHIMLSGLSNYFVYAFDIPVFFFLSGMLYKEEKYPKIGQLIRRRIKTLLIPYVIFSFITWLIWAVYNINSGENLLYSLAETFIAQGSGGYLSHNTPLWFVTCLFVVEVIYFYINKLDYKLNILICILLAVLGSLMTLDNGVVDFTKLPWNIEVAAAVIIFYSLGNIFAKNNGLKKLKKFENERVGGVSVALWIIATAATVCIAYVNESVSFAHNDMGNYMGLIYLSSITGIISVGLFTGWLEAISIPFLKFIGKNSFYFMAIHVPLKNIIVAIFSRLLHCSASAVCSGYLMSLIVFALTLSITSVIVYCINVLKNKVKPVKG